MPVARVTKEEKVYVVRYRDGRRERLTIPEGCKVTYGKLTPPGAGDRFGGDGSGTYAIRVYEGGEGIQLGVFPGVVSFREVNNIKVERLTSDDHGEPVWQVDPGDDLTVEVADALGKKASHYENGFDLV